MLLAVIADDLSAGIRLVAQHLKAGLGSESVQQVFRKTVREGGQRVGTQQTGNLPVADGGILAGAGLTEAGKAADRLGHGGAAGHTVQVEHAQLGQIVALKIGVAGNGAQGVGACIAKLWGVRLSADAEAIENDQKNTFCHRLSPVCIINIVCVEYVEYTYLRLYPILGGL